MIPGALSEPRTSFGGVAGSISFRQTIEKEEFAEGYRRFRVRPLYSEATKPAKALLFGVPSNRRATSFLGDF